LTDPTPTPLKHSGPFRLIFCVQSSAGLLSPSALLEGIGVKAAFSSCFSNVELSIRMACLQTFTLVHQTIEEFREPLVCFPCFYAPSPPLWGCFPSSFKFDSFSESPPSLPPLSPLFILEPQTFLVSLDPGTQLP